MAPAALAVVHRLGVILAVSFSSLTCGPSFQAVYESDVQFEHCYGLDMGTASPDAKRSCWRTWFASYTYGQSRDRVDYAATRLNELSTDPVVVAATESAAAASHPLAVAGSPMPKDAFVPPPNVSDGHGEPSLTTDGGAPSAATHESAPRAPGAECADACSRRWSTCYGSCREVACGACDRAYRSCMPLCFHEDASSARPGR